MRRLQVVRPRRRGHRARQVLHVRAARLRAGGGVHAALPGARLRGPDDRAAQLRRGHDPLRAADQGGRRRGGVQRPGHPRHAAPGAAADRADRDQVLPRAVRGHQGPGHRRHPLVLDGQHLEPGERPARVRDQGLPGRAVLAFPRHPAGRSATGSTSAGRSACSRSARATNDLVFVGGGAGMAPILSLLRSMAERGISRKATYYYGARGRRDLCFEEELRGLERRCPTSVTCLRCPSRPTATSGTARPA